MEDRVKELINIALNDMYITYTDFLTPNIYKEFEKKYKGIYVESFGKLRKMLAFCPKDFVDYINFPITLLKIEVNNKFRVYDNKDFLGSIMSLNIDRKYIGDLFVKDNICYLYVSNKVLELVLSLDRVAKNACIVSIVTENIELDFTYEIKEYTISSIRLDNIVSAITNMSRAKTKEYIELGLCTLDYKEEFNISKQLEENTIISLKSYGRYIFVGQKKQSKKGKPVIEIKKYI